MMEIVLWLTAMTLLKGWLKSSLRRFSGAEGNLLVADEAVDGGDANYDRAGNIAGHRLARCDVLKERKGTAAQMVFHYTEKNVERCRVAVNCRLEETRQRGECDQAGDHAGAV